MQPLYVSFMKPLSVYCSDALKYWLRSHPDRLVTQYKIGGLFVRAATMETAINDFRKTEI